MPELSEYQTKVAKWLIAVAVVAALAFFGVTEPQQGDIPPFPTEDLYTLEGVSHMDGLTITTDLTVGDDAAITDDLTVTGATAMNGGITADTSAFTVADATGNVSTAGTLTAAGATNLNSTLDVDGNITSGTGAITITDNVMLDGAADAIQLQVQGYTTQTNSLLVLEQSDGTDSLTVANDGSTTIKDQLVLDGDSDEVQLTVQGHSSQTSNTFVVEQSGGADVFTVANSGSLTTITDTEHIGLPSVLSASVVTTTTNGSLWTIADGEIWFIHAAFCHVTADFDCNGDDCALDLGIGEDTDALIDLDDAELQAADVDEANAPAGWQGYSADTAGLFIADTGHTVLAPSGAPETIDLAVAGTDISAGTATCYLVYTRVE